MERARLPSFNPSCPSKPNELHIPSFTEPESLRSIETPTSPTRAARIAFAPKCDEIRNRVLDALQTEYHVLSEWMPALLETSSATNSAHSSPKSDLEKKSKNTSNANSAGFKETADRLKAITTQLLSLLATPVVLLVDDAQWIDSGSLQLLWQWITDDSLPQLLVFCCYRNDEVAANHLLMQKFCLDFFFIFLAHRANLSMSCSSPWGTSSGIGRETEKRRRRNKSSKLQIRTCRCGLTQINLPREETKAHSASFSPTQIEVQDLCLKEDL